MIDFQVIFLLLVVTDGDEKETLILFFFQRATKVSWLTQM